MNIYLISRTNNVGKLLRAGHPTPTPYIRLNFYREGEVGLSNALTSCWSFLSLPTCNLVQPKRLYTYLSCTFLHMNLTWVHTGTCFHPCFTHLQHTNIQHTKIGGKSPSRMMNDLLGEGDYHVVYINI